MGKKKTLVNIDLSHISVQNIKIVLFIVFYTPYIYKTIAFYYFGNNEKV